MGDSNEISASQRPPAVPPRSPSRPLDNSFWNGNGVVVVKQRTSASANESRWAAGTGRRVSQVVRRTYDILRTNRLARRLVDTGRPSGFCTRRSPTSPRAKSKYIIAASDTYVFFDRRPAALYTWVTGPNPGASDTARQEQVKSAYPSPSRVPTCGSHGCVRFAHTFRDGL